MSEKSRGRRPSIDWSKYLRDGESLEPKQGYTVVELNTLRKRKFDAEKRLSEAERERLQEQREEQAEESAAHRKLGLLYFSETRRNRPAETAAEEIEAHRVFLRAFGDEPDVIEGESLRQLAKRVWVRWLRDQADTSGDAWAPALNPLSKQFEFHAFIIKSGAEPGFFESDWQPPADCNNGEEDRPINVHSLDNWPWRIVKAPEPEPRKPERSPEPQPKRFSQFDFLRPALTPYSTVGGPQSNATIDPVARQ
jgi:hypothetical protein